MPSKHIQHRLDFPAPTRAQTIKFSLSGATVYATPLDGAYQRAYIYLNKAGLSPTLTPDGYLIFPFKNYKSMDVLTSLVTQILDEDLRVFRMLLDADKERSSIFYIDRFSADEITITWSNDGYERSTIIKVANEYLLLMLGLSFIYSPQARALTERARVLPVVLGRATKTLEGHIEIATQVPQMLEDSQIPYLFKIGPGLYGVPGTQTEYLRTRKDIVFTPNTGNRMSQNSYGLESVRKRVPDVLRTSVDELGPLLNHIDSTASLVLKCSTRREMVALMLLAPAASSSVVVVAHPQSWWLWYVYGRHLGLSVGHIGGQEDVLLVTYEHWEHVAHRVVSDRIIYDCLKQDVHVENQFHSSVLDCRRIALLGANPSFAERLRAAYLVRPSEFKVYLESLSLSEHPRDLRVQQHIDVYAKEFELSPAANSALPKVESIDVTMSSAQQLSYAQALRAPFDLERIQDIIDTGSSEYLSPKVAKALELAVKHNKEGSSLTVVTESTKTAKLLNSLCAKAGLTTLAFAQEDNNLRPSSENILYYNTCLSFDEMYTQFTLLAPGGNMYYLRMDSTHSTAMDVVAFTRISTGNKNKTLSNVEVEYMKNCLRNS